MYVILINVCFVQYIQNHGIDFFIRRMQMSLISIAVDGPAGAGKSTIAKNVAKAFNINYVDTGAMYRTIAYYFLQRGIDPNDAGLVAKDLDNIQIKVKYEDGVQKMLLEDEDVTDTIRNQEVGNAASAVAVHRIVREKLVSLQQQLAVTNSVIMDGRDIGTYVLPKADLKIYLTASVEKRAQRRVGELVAKGQQADVEQIKKEIEERDYRDMNRDYAPLKKAEDAIEIDTTMLNIDEVTKRVLDIYNDGNK